jgi:acetyl esterase/lipase
MKKFTFTVICLLFVISIVNAQRWTATYSDVDYVGNGNSKQMLDIYIPSGVTTATATIVHIHGGAFLMGSKGVSEQASFQTFYNNGYICVDINYRYSSDSIWPAQIYDCKAAIRYLKTNADLYHIDTCKIGVIGESAGGYLVSMLGTTAEVSQLEGLHLGSVNATSRVHAVVDLFGPINFLTMDSEAATIGFTINTNASSSPESKLMGAAVQTIPALVAQANPTTYITADDAAFFISAGSVDQNIPYSQGQNFCNALIPVIGSEHASFELIAGAGHGGSTWHSTTQDAKYLTFFNSNLTGCIPAETSSSNFIKSELLIYPNPVSESFSLVMTNDKAFDITVFNCNGQNIIYKNGVTNSMNISCENIPSGIYFIKAISGNEIVSTYFIKQ